MTSSLPIDGRGPQRASYPSALRCALGTPVPAARPASAQADIALAAMQGAPWHDFPLRDAILMQFSSLPHWLAGARADAAPSLLEIGPGSGYTAYRLSRHPVRLTLVEHAAAVAAQLTRRFQTAARTDSGRVSCVQADACGPGLAARLRAAGLPSHYDFAYALDMFEYTRRPQACLANLAAILRPGGELFLTFPNQGPPRGDGVTYFSSLASPALLLQRAGFQRWQMFAVHLRPWAAAVYACAHEAPLWAYRRLRGPGTHARPQTYESTWAFQHSGRLQANATALHRAWDLLATALQADGPWFAARELRRGKLAGQWVIRAWT